MNTEFLKERIKQFNRRIPVYGEGRYIACWADLAWSFLRYGASPDDYFRYEFYRKSAYERDKFITYRRSRNLIKEYNNSDEIIKVEDKRNSNRIFSRFISREWLDVCSCTFDEFQKFVLKHKEVIVKPACGGKGKGIHKYCYSNGDDLEEKFKEIKGMLVEEVITQHKSMASLNHTSVNTVRVCTFLHREQVNILGCYMRVGVTKSVIDNISAGGIFASIDIDTGTIFTPCINEKLERYLIHPLSGIQLIGFKVPNWDILLSTVKEAPLLLPGLRYMGWDFAILDNGVELIEANHDHAHSVPQMADQTGKYQVIRKIANSR